MDNKNLSERESWLLIQQMIQTAREDNQQTGTAWLIWGWLLFIASILSLILSFTPYHTYIGMVWSGMLALGALVYTFTHVRQEEKKVVKTYVHELLEKFTTGFFISLFIMVVATFVSNASFSFGYFYVLYGFLMFVYGSAIRFRPLIVGAVVNWAGAIAIFMIDDFKYDMVVSAIAVLIGYLVPGYILRAKYRKGLPS
jgi:hypothetical protein